MAKKKAATILERAEDVAGEFDPAAESLEFAPEVVLLSTLKPHPRNYCVHPDDQIEHLAESLRANGWYRNVVAARDYTILAGHGIVQAAKALGMASGPVVRLNMDPGDPRALKILAADNEVRHLAEVDDRMLSELLKQVKDEAPEGLLGTGYDEAMLANLVFVTRPQSEVKTFDAASEWASAGTPEYQDTESSLKASIRFRSHEDREEFARVLGLPTPNQTVVTITGWFPIRENEDISSVRFNG